MTQHASPRVVVLGSGSSGNATLISDGETSVLIDCGFSAREVTRRLAAAGVAPDSISAILVTHEHTDHVAGIDVFCRRHSPTCTVYATRGTAEAGRVGDPQRVLRVKNGEAVQVGSLDVVPFRTSHDAREPVGFRIETRVGSVGVATDSGTLTPEAHEALAGCCIIAIESNHDIRMLETGPYPAYLKRRIRSHVGHLSNIDAAAAVESLAHGGLRHVFAMHRSRTNNTDALAAAGLTDALKRLGLQVPVTVASQVSVSDSLPPQGRLFEASA